MVADLLALPWQPGGHLGIEVLAYDDAVAIDLVVGIMASAEVAAEVAQAHNAGLAVHPAAAEGNRSSGPAWLRWSRGFPGATIGVNTGTA